MTTGMATLLQITKASKTYGDQILLDQAEAVISDNTKVGFVGRNGAGKSTLLRIILGEEELDSGEVIRHPNLRLGYLRQHDTWLPGETTVEFLMRDSGQPDWKCGEIAGQFEIKGQYLEGPIDKLSGGWQTRAKLAALLLHEPNLLLLDEPTNFLDVRTQILLEHFLKDYRSACMIVSHDRAFLMSTCTHTLDLSRGKLTTFPGKIDAFLTYQEEERVRGERTNAATMVKKKNLEEFIARNKARAATASLAQSKAKALAKLEFTEVLYDLPTVNIRAPKVEPRKGIAVRCVDLAIGYPDRQIADDIQLEIDHGQRAAIVGDNGQGKTTFLRTLVDSLKPRDGEVKWGHGCKIGVYAQHVYSSLPKDYTVLQYLKSKSKIGTSDQQVLDVAGSFLFRGSAVEKDIPVLSGGERARLCMAALLLNDLNVLILDEPGNHLDVDTVEALAEALIEFKGTVIFTSHDRFFMGRVATNIIEVREGRVTNYSGNYENYLYMVNKEIDDGERELAATKAKVPGAALQSARPAIRNEKEIRKDLKATEKLIAQLDTSKKELTEKFTNTRNSSEATKLEAELERVTNELSAAEEQWSVFWLELGDDA
jgi:ATP-binding cassette, subfamily F, member 3